MAENGDNYLDYDEDGVIASIQDDIKTLKRLESYEIVQHPLGHEIAARIRFLRTQATDLVAEAKVAMRHPAPAVRAQRWAGVIDGERTLRFHLDEVVDNMAEVADLMEGYESDEYF